MNAIKMLKEDHAHFRQALQELKDSDASAPQKRRDMAVQMRNDLHIHASIEEEIFYPAVRKAAAGALDTLYFQALEEHRAAQDLILPDLLRTDPGSSRFAGRVNVLKEILELHLLEEEQTLFTRAQSLLGSDELRRLGEKMMARRDELLAQEDHPSLLLHPLETVVKIGDKVVRTGSAVLREAAGALSAAADARRDRDTHDQR